MGICSVPVHTIEWVSAIDIVVSVLPTIHQCTIRRSLHVHVLLVTFMW